MTQVYVYFSRTQMAEAAILKVKQAMGDDTRLIHVQSASSYSGALGFLKAIFHQMGTKQPKLKPMDAVDLSQYDRVVIATPMWAGKVPAPLRTFFALNKGIHHTAYIVTLSDAQGKGTDKLFDELDALTGVHRDAAVYCATLDPEQEAKLSAFIQELKK
jgi:hypothetical protein